MSGTSAVRRVGIFGHVGNGNLGDEAIVSVVIENIRRRYPSAEILGFTLKPEDTVLRHKIAAFPIRRVAGIPNHSTPDVAGNADSQSVAPSATLLGQAKATLRTFPRVYGILKQILYETRRKSPASCFRVTKERKASTC
jgi:polysaccharide pyruvyl transferase WcaK-like protein